MTPVYSAVREGEVVPDFTLPDDAGKLVRLSDFRGRRVVLFFYPKDSTAGCTIEAADFRDRHAQFKRSKVQVLGISTGSVKAKAKFRATQQLPYPLLADEAQEAAMAYGVWCEKMLYGRKYFGIMRTTYLISEDGRLERVWENVRHEGHAAEVLAFVRGISVARKPQAKRKK